jgi:hypothetical protein
MFLWLMVRYEALISIGYESYKRMGNYFFYGERWGHFDVTAVRTASRENLRNSKLAHCSIKLSRAEQHEGITINF